MSVCTHSKMCYKEMVLAMMKVVGFRDLQGEKVAEHQKEQFSSSPGTG